MHRGYAHLPKGKPRSPPRRDRPDLQGSSRMASTRSQASAKEDLNIDDFGDMGSDEDDFQTLAANFVPPKPPARPQYNLVPYGLLRDDDELIEDDYDGVPISESSTSSPKPESPKTSPWKISPQKEEIKGFPITVLGERNPDIRQNPVIPKWANDGRNQDRAQPNRFQGSGSSMGAVGGNKMSSLGTPNPQIGKGRWDKTGQASAALSGTTRSNIPSHMGIEVGKSFVRAQDESNPFMNQSQTLSGNPRNLVHAKDDRDSFLQTSLRQASLGSSTKNFVPPKPLGNTNDRQGSSNSRFPASNVPSTRSYDVPSSSWNNPTKTVQSNTSAWPGQVGKSPANVTEPASSVPNQNPQITAALQAITGFTQLDPQTGLSLLLQAGQNPTLAAALLNTISNVGLASSGMTSSSNPAIQASLKPAGAPVAAALPNPGTPLKMPMPDGSGATRFPAPDLNALVFDPSTGFRFDDSTGLHYDANSGYFFNCKLKIYLRWDKFTQTYLRVENPPRLPRFITNTPTDPPGYQRGSSLPSQGVLEPSRSLQNPQFANEITQSINAFPPGSYNPDVGAVKNILEPKSTVPPVQPCVTPSYNYSGGSNSFVESRSSEANLKSAAEQKLANLPNLAETSLFNKLRKAKLASQTKPDRKRWGEPDPLLEAVQKHTNETSQSQTSVLNLEEILQRSRQFMKGSGHHVLTPVDSIKDKVTLTTPGQIGAGRNIISRSRSPGRQRQRSPSLEKPGNRRLKTSVSPQPRKRSRGRSPDTRRGRPHSKGRSPGNHDRGRKSSSPQFGGRPSPSRGRNANNRSRVKPMSPENKKRRSDSRGRSPNVRVRRRQSVTPEARGRKSVSRGRSPRRAKPMSPEARKRRSHSRGRSPGVPARRRQSFSPEGRRKKSLSPEARKRGRSPVRRKGKSSKSPVSKCRRTSKVGHSNRKLPVRLSKSPERGRQLSKTPDRTSLNKSPPAVVKVVLNQSPGGSKVGLRDDKRGANLLSVDKRTVLRKFTSNDVGSADKARATSPGKGNLKSSEGGNSCQKSLNQRFGMKDTHNRSNSKLNQQEEKVTELKPIPYDTPQGAGKKAKRANKNEDVSGLKSLSNLRNQATDKQSEETKKKQDMKTQPTKDRTTDRQPAKTNLTIDKDERQSRNHRLVSERTFSNTWKTKKPEPIGQVLSSTKRDGTNQESNLPAETPIGAVGEKEKADLGIEEELEESNDFDFLTDTLDDDKESTVIDEYEEILDYQDVDSNLESRFHDSTSIETDQKSRDKEAKKSSSKESIESPVIDLNLDSCERSFEISTSVDSAQVNLQCSSVDDPELKDVPTNTLGNQEPVPQGRMDVKGTETLKDKDIKHDGKDVFKRDEAQDSKSSLDNLACSKNEGSAKSNKLSKTLDVVPASVKNKRKETKNEDDQKSIVKLADQSDDGSLIKTVHDQEKALKPSDLNVGEKPLAQVKGSPSQEVSNKAMDLGEEKASDELKTSNEKKIGKSPTGVKTTKSNIGQGGKTEFSTGKGTINQPQVGTSKGKSLDGKTNKVPGKNSEPVGVGISVNDGKAQGTSDSKQSKAINPQGDKEEPLLQVRSVSDIETFLLLSAKEVEAKREQGHDSNASKKEKKSDIFSRLGDKLAVTEESGSTVESELQAGTSIKPEKQSKQTSTSALPGKVEKPNPPAASGITKKAKPEDPCESLFDDEPTPTVLLGPMNFIEPANNFQNFTQKYMNIALKQENVPFRKVYVHHEDGTGAPYHYILITFPFAHVAADWFNKHKGIYKADLKIFKRTPGHTKHKFIPNATAYLHFTEPNWICTVCKKSNFPPRSLCFCCFQNKDPNGLSPLILLDKGRPPFKNSTWVGTPKLKFFATKEKVIESVPPLDGFDIQRIEMIMDEEMGLPAGICVFELPSIIEAGKLKKYLNHRDVECVALEMNERFFESVESSKQTARAKKTAPSESRRDPPVTVRDLHQPLSEEGRRSLRDVPEIRARSPRIPCREVRVTKVTPDTTQDRRLNHSPGSEYRPPSIGYKSPSRHVPRVEEDRYRSPEPCSSRAVISMERSVRAISPKPGIEPIHYREAGQFHRSPVRRSPAYLSPPRYRSRSPIRDSLNRHSPPRRSRSPLARRISPLPKRHSPPTRGRSPLARRGSPIPKRRSPPPRSHSPLARRSSPFPNRHSPPPRSRSPLARRGSPVSRRRSPSPRSRSPLARRISPFPKRHSPPPRGRSPLARRGSPLARRGSPLARRGSPLARRGSPFPKRRSPSPRRRPPSPRGPSPSPRFRSPSPRLCSPPPMRRSFSPRRRSPSPRHVTPPPRHGFSSGPRPTKPDGRSDWSYPPPDPKLFRFEPRSGLDYDPITTLYYEPSSCCFYNDDTNEWLEYEPRTGCYRVVR